MKLRERVKALLEQAKENIGVDDEVRIMLHPMKRKIASVSLKTKTIRINKNLLETLNDDELYYILVHELIHIKLSSLNHGNGFQKFLRKIYAPQDPEAIENMLIKKLAYIYMRAKLRDQLL